MPWTEKADSRGMGHMPQEKAVYEEVDSVGKMWAIANSSAIWKPVPGTHHLHLVFFYKNNIDLFRKKTVLLFMFTTHLNNVIQSILLGQWT